MAANLINQLSTANTFQHWLNATETLISTVNLLTDGNGQSFFANTRIIIGGPGANVSLNVETGATINVIAGNIANITNVTTRNLIVTANVENLNVTNDLFVGDDLTVYGDALITGNLTVSGNITLDALGFDDLSVSGSGSFGNTLSVTGTTTLSNVAITGNVASINVTSQANFANNVRIHGDLIVSGNVTLDAIGFDDLSVAGSANIANNLNVTGTANTTGNATFVHAEVTGTLTANLMLGNANTKIFDAISASSGESIAFAIALG